MKYENRLPYEGINAGHGGAVEWFSTFASLQARPPAGTTAAEFLRLHPLTASRTAAVSAWAQSRGVPLTGPVRPLPPAALAAIRDEARRRG